MSRGGFLIRFIDIGLLILFGFLMISDIENFSNIQMPGSEDQAVQDDPRRMTLVTVSISASGVFSVSELESNTVARGIETLAALEALLVDVRDRHEAAGRQVVVLIDPDENAIVQRMVDVMDLCDRNGILKNINVESLKL